MNRPIKFRAWDKKKQEWLNDSWLKYVCPNDGVVALITYAPNRTGGYDPKSCRQLTNPEVNNLEITQFTGLLDKNGKEIYEGDIVEWRTKGDEKDRMAVEFIVRYGQLETYPTINITSEVIGNIYENLDLLHV